MAAFQTLVLILLSASPLMLAWLWLVGCRVFSENKFDAQQLAALTALDQVCIVEELARLRSVGSRLCS